MNEAIAPNATAIADAMLKHTGEILRGRVAVAPAQKPFADHVIDTLKSIGAPGMMISGQRSLDAINALLKMAEIEQAKPAIVPRLAAHFVNDAPEGATPHFSQVGARFAEESDVFPLYFAPHESTSGDGAARLSTARISELWNGMPGGHGGFCKQWGYYQFAQAVEDEVRKSVLAAPFPIIHAQIGEPL
jgi:hypothetical protein